MDTNRIRYFCTFADVGNLRRTAEMVGLSHSALSKSLKVLEEELSKKLFIQAGRELKHTDEGKLFHKKAKHFLAELDLLLNEEKQLEKEIKIGSFEVFTSYFFAKILSDDFKDYNIALIEYIPGQMEKALLDGVIDLAITYEPIPMKGLDYLKISSIQMNFFGHQKFQAEEDILSLPFVAPSMPLTDTPSGVKGLDGFPDDRYQRKIKFKCDLLETALQLCSYGACVGFFPTFVVELYNQTVISKRKLIKLSSPIKFKPVKRDVYIIKRESTLENQLVKKLAKHLRIICG